MDGCNNVFLCNNLLSLSFICSALLASNIRLGDFILFANTELLRLGVGGVYCLDLKVESTGGFRLVVSGVFA